jgi:hypothetical protein
LKEARPNVRNKLLPTKPMSKTGETPLRAGEGVRTLDNDVGNVVLYQLSYARKSATEFNDESRVGKL